VRRGSEREQEPHRADAQLLHVRVSRALDRVDERTAEARTALLEQTHSGVDALLLFAAERVPPLPELVSELDRPHPPPHYTVERICRPQNIDAPGTARRDRRTRTVRRAVAVDGGARRAANVEPYLGVGTSDPRRFPARPRLRTAG